MGAVRGDLVARRPRSATGCSQTSNGHQPGRHVERQGRDVLGVDLRYRILRPASVAHRLSARSQCCVQAVDRDPGQPVVLQRVGHEPHDRRACARGRRPARLSIRRSISAAANRGGSACAVSGPMMCTRSMPTFARACCHDVGRLLLDVDLAAVGHRRAVEQVHAPSRCSRTSATASARTRSGSSVSFWKHLQKAPASRRTRRPDWRANQRVGVMHGELPAGGAPHRKAADARSRSSSMR